MLYIFDLCYDKLFDFKDKHGIFSTKQLALYLTSYSQTRNIIDIKNSIYEKSISKLKNGITDDQKVKYEDQAIELAFHIYRHWFKFTVPKVLRVFDSLQKYACTQLGFKPGAYQFYVELLENDFIPSNLSILMEYGIPNTTLNKLNKLIPSNLSEDEVVAYVEKNKRQLCNELNQYEIERLNAEL